MCCSRWNYFGTSVEYCGVRCQAGNNLFHGRCTYYYIQGEYTACGIRHSDSEYIAALNAPQFDVHTSNGNPNRNSLCNR
ncbi:unnamed protein product, partial [Rotaria sp. Silwood1]